MSVWCQDEAGPYQAIPQPGPSWGLIGQPAKQPHEYFRGGTAKLLTLFHPAIGKVRAEAVESTCNAVLHPWLKTQLSAILQEEAAQAVPDPREALDPIRQWSSWGFTPEQIQDLALPPRIKLILVLDNLKGHYTKDWVQWAQQQGILLLYTPLGGSWLNMAESVQPRIYESPARDAGSQFLPMVVPRGSLSGANAQCDRRGSH